MKNERTIVDELIAGNARISDYDLDSEFDDGELRALLDAEIITPQDLSDWRASDMIISGVLSYDEYPFDCFSHYEQVRQMEHECVGRREFRSRADLEEYDGDDWLVLLKAWPTLAAEAPWDRIRKEASADEWLEFLMNCPEHADKADWKHLLVQGDRSRYFKMLAKQPALYEKTADKTELLNSDSALWVELLIERPEFAKIYPMENLDEVDEVEHLLLHRPELVWQITWDRENLPVKLCIVNPQPEIMRFHPEHAARIPADLSKPLKMILLKVLHYTPEDAESYANFIGHNKETFAGIYSFRTAENIIRLFRETMDFTGLPLTIRMEQIEK